MQLVDAALKIIPDSRGEDTLETELTNEKFSVVASVPSGKSRGAHEVFTLAPQEALSKFRSIKPEILARAFSNQEEFDNFLISLDGTPDKKNLGGNLILALSLAWARLKAQIEKKELFEYIAGELGIKNNELEFPRPIFNVINGGTHAQNKLSFQEFQIIPEVSDFGIAYGLGMKFYKELREFLEKKFGRENVSLGDEAGFSAPFKNNEEALQILSELIASRRYPLRIGLDAAASQFYKEGRYALDGKEYSSEELKNFYLELIEKYNLLSIEDPFFEEDFDSFGDLNKSTGAIIVTDDLTTTSPERLNLAIQKKSGKAILIKPNQIGTLTETLKVVEMAYKNSWQTVVSHRSGETMDNFIADLAVGIGAWGIKAGAPATLERLAKYERLLEISKVK